MSVSCSIHTYQVAQRATIAHQCPMCQGHLKKHINGPWKPEAWNRARPSFCACPGWLPASLMMIRSKMNELAWRYHFPIISLWEIFYTSRAANFIVSGPIWPRTRPRFGISSLPASKKRIGSKTTEKRWRHLFSHYKSTGAFCCDGNQSFDPICPKTLCSHSPTPMMLHIKFDQDWPTGFRDIQVQKCEIFVTQGQVTAKWVVWFGPKSNLTELLCLSWLPASLMMIN